MSASPDLARGAELWAVVAGPHEPALAALQDPERDAMAAVAWCSAHLVAVDQVLHRAVGRHLPAGRRRVQALRSGDHLLQQALFRLDRRLTGDLHLAQVPFADLAEQVRQGLRVHAEAERMVVRELAEKLSPSAQQRLSEDLVKAMLRAPSRPHPHTRHTPFSALVTRVDALVDRVRDVMDNRVVPTPHVIRQTLAPGRWGCYLLGTPFPAVEPAQDGAASAGPTTGPPITPPGATALEPDGRRGA